jgi:primosomal protein N' (replication factor Y) (superfamily II helicase)
MPKNPQTSPAPLYVEAALPLPVRRLFTYRLPPEFAADVRLGARLIVPFGKRSMTAYAAGFRDDLPPGLDEADVKDAAELIDAEPLITDEILGLTEWAADYYAASWGEVLKASLPAGINAAVASSYTITEAGRSALAAAKSTKAVKWQILCRLAENGETGQADLAKIFGAAAVRRSAGELARLGHVSAKRSTAEPKVKAKRQKAVRLISETPEPDAKPLTDVQVRIIAALRAAGGEMLFADLLGNADTGASPINTLARRGMIEVYVREVRRDPLGDAAIPAHERLTLNTEQKFVFGEIEKALAAGGYKAFLLHGVTGSGKTEVYIRAMRAALEMGRSSLMLVPEIALTPIFSRRLRAVFGSDVAILHSNLSPGERFDEWRRIRGGEARIAIGTRSAVFAPLEDLGLVIVDEEHDTSYRQNESPYYNGRDVAVKRAHAAGAVIVLGSATPALESFHNAQTGKYQYLQLPRRIGGRPLAKAELIDMREVFRRAGKDVIFSPKLIEAVEKTHSKGEQTIILLNRRGFSSFVLCRSCGESLRCKNCDITMTYHKRDGRLVCHYCGYFADTPKQCPFCESEYLYFIGQGTEQLEDVLNKRFAGLRISRIDRDTMSRKGEMAKTLLAFDKGEIDILVGTQMIAKGHDFHNVTLVGVVSVDTGLGLPDFRAAERTFQLLTQVAGRAGRGKLAGRVLIQTYYPEHYALRHAAEQDFEGFYNEEIRYRQRMSYPPFVALASILIKHKDEKYAVRSGRILRESLDRANAGNAVRLLGPAQAAIARIKNEYRFQIILKSPDRRSLRTLIDTALAEAETRGADRRIVYIEIDPVDLM